MNKYEKLLDTLMENGWLARFMFEMVWEMPAIKQKPSEKFMQLLIDDFKRGVVNDLATNSTVFYDMLVWWIDNKGEGVSE